MTMLNKFALITLCRDEIAPRFDMTVEVYLAPLALAEDQEQAEGKHLVLAHPSSEELCDLATRSGVAVVVCGGIEEDYYHYLRWKHIDVICDVVGPLDRVLAELRSGSLGAGDCLYAHKQQGRMPG